MALSSTETYQLEKSVWSEADFDKMGWHDAVVHALAFDAEHYELLFDIDYLFAWVDPVPPSPYFTFWLAPATMVFRDVWDLKIDYDASLGFQLQGISRSEPRIRPHPHPEGRKEEHRWTLDANEGAISFWATGYFLYTRKIPVRHAKQSLGLSERGGISFERLSKPQWTSRTKSVQTPEPRACRFTFLGFPFTWLQAARRLQALCLTSHVMRKG